jgi:hypothetical protein
VSSNLCPSIHASQALITSYLPAAWKKRKLGSIFSNLALLNLSKEM